ncbi:MAG: response regulator transcription factor [Flavobacterium sp.]|uniref:response regulator transcription factor n=1 Tax=Flavobacterium sp. TaxID=239 RepID=UPI003263B149
MQNISIAIFDDHPLIISAITNELFLHQNIKLLFTANDKITFHEFLKQQQPDVLVLDIVADDILGLELFNFVLSNYPTCKIIAHSSLSSTTLVENLLNIGVKGYVNKKYPIEILFAAIKTVFDDKVYVSNEYLFLTSQFQKPQTALLTDREIEIVNMIGNEFTSNEIAEKLSLSINTIESHRKRIFQKLNVKNVAGMIMESARLGYIK